MLRRAGYTGGSCVPPCNESGGTRFSLEDDMNWIVIVVAIIALLGCTVSAYAFGYGRGWKDARKWGSP